MEYRFVAADGAAVSSFAADALVLVLSPEQSAAGCAPLQPVIDDAIKAVQEEAADRVLEMLLGAMAELRMGDPGRLSTDVGPVIDEEARANIERLELKLDEQPANRPAGARSR